MILRDPDPFTFDIYKLFLNIIALYEEQGGNILQMAALLTEKSRYQEQYLNNTVGVAKRKIIEFSTLWLFSLATPIPLTLWTITKCWKPSAIVIATTFLLPPT